MWTVKPPLMFIKKTSLLFLFWSCGRLASQELISEGRLMCWSFIRGATELALVAGGGQRAKLGRGKSWVQGRPHWAQQPHSELGARTACPSCCPALGCQSLDAGCPGKKPPTFSAARGTNPSVLMWGSGWQSIASMTALIFF